MSYILCNSPIADGSLGVDGHTLNALVNTATIDPSFYTGQTLAGSPANTDTLLLVRQDGTFARIIYSNILNQDVVRKALGNVGAPNAIINGDMAVWQRNNTFNNVANAAYTADRWRCDYVMATGKFNITQLDLGGSLAGTVNNYQPRYALRATVATTQGSLLSTEFFTISQRVEKQRARFLYDNVHSLEIWLRTSVAGTYSVCIRNADSSQFYKQDVSIGTPNAWQRVTIQNIPAMPTASGSWGTNETDFSYQVSVCIAAGSNFQATQQNVWTAGNMLATASQTNLLATGAATFDICLCQHEPGPVSTGFLPAAFDENLWQCGRYRCQSYQYGTAPGTATSVGQCAGVATSATGAIANIAFPNRMRAIPTVAFFKPSTDGSGADGATTASAANVGDNGFASLTGTGMTGGSSVGFQFTADAEL
jgi:hypothetical protein